MLASYMWSRTIVPTLAMYLLSSEDEYHGEEHIGERWASSAAINRVRAEFEKFRMVTESLVCPAFAEALRCMLLAFCVFSVLLVGLLGRDFFPNVDAGRSPAHARSHGLRIEETARSPTR